MRLPLGAARSILGWTIVLSLTAGGIGRGADGGRERRLSLAVSYDDNVFESARDPRGDMAGNLTLHLAGGTRSSDGPSLSMLYKAGAEIYARHSIENRTVHDLQLRVGGRVSSRAAVGLTCQGRTKLHLDGDRGYLVVRAWPFLNWSASPRLRGGLFGSFSSMNDVQGSLFDYRQIGAGLFVERTLSDRITGKVQAAFNEYGLERQALDYRLFEPGVRRWVVLGRRHRDAHREVSLFLDVYHGALIEGEISYLAVRSNSYGYSHDLFRFKCLAAKTVTRTVTARFYWAVLLKRHSDDLEPFLRLRSDTEEEESSFALLDLTRDLGDRSSLQLRLGLYRFQSPFLDLTYRKAVTSLGITRRL